jgi:hypothetical protein
MTSTERSTGKGPFIDDLRVLHRYARSRLPDEKLSQRDLAAAMEELGIDLSVDVISAAFARLEREYDVVVMERRPTHGVRGREVAPDPDVPEHLDHPEDWDAYSSPAFSSRNKSRLTLDGAIFAEVSSLFAGYEFIAKAGTARTQPGVEGMKSRPDAADRNAVLGWLRMERRRLQKIVEAIRSPEGSVFLLRQPDQDFGLIAEPMDARIMELAAPQQVEYPDDPQRD